MTEDDEPNRRRATIPAGMLGVLLLLVASAAVFAAGSLPTLEKPAITIIIDDMGNHERYGDAALEIPGAITYAFLPFTPFAERQAELAHSLGKEVMLHQPMQSHEGKRMGPGGLHLHMTERRFKRTLKRNLSAVPHVRGMNNHMGSLLTRHPGAMEWLMQSIQQQDLFFVDSRTASRSMGRVLANEYQVPNASRDVFLDNNRDPMAIRSQFRELIHKARRRGYAIGIGHPYPETAQVLKEELDKLELYGVRLIPASEMIALQRRKTPWHAPSYPSPQVVKSSKPSP